MIELIESGKISVKKGYHLVSYILNDEKLFFLSNLKVLNGQDNKGLSRCIKVLYNGRIKLTYSIKDLKPLTELIGFVSFSTFLSILAGILKIVCDVRNNGFLSAANLNLDPESIYVEPETLEAKLHYLPMVPGSVDEYTEGMKFRRDIATIIRKEPMFRSSAADEVCRKLDDPAVLTEDLLMFFSEIARDDPEAAFLPHTEELTDETRQFSQGIKLISADPSEPYCFFINKQDFILGKGSQVADGVIAHSTVSRKHCRISFDGEHYFIEDLDSTNGTKKNGIRLHSYRKERLDPGDRIWISGIELRVEK